MNTKQISLILILLTSSLFGCSDSTQNKSQMTASPNSDGVIYGKDSIQELDLDSKVRMNLASVAAIFDSSDMKVVNGFVQLVDQQVPDVYPSCPNFKLNKQYASAHCSGILVGRQVVLTAGHCISDDFTCENMSVAFGYDAQSVGVHGNTTIPQKNVYRCKEVQRDPKKDAARIILDRPVSWSIPLPRRAPPTPDRTWVGQKVHSFGFTLGTPVKKAEGTIRSYNSKTGEVVTTLDTFDRNSGSPVFTEDQFFVGILVKGEEDFVPNADDPYSCQPVKHCKENECSGQTVLTWWDLDVMSMPGGSSGW